MVAQQEGTCGLAAQTDEAVAAVPRTSSAILNVDAVFNLPNSGQTVAQISVPFSLYYRRVGGHAVQLVLIGGVAVDVVRNRVCHKSLTLPESLAPSGPGKAATAKAMLLVHTEILLELI
jgi:hypothetical protein